MITRYFIFVILILLASSCQDQTITEETIISQLTPPTGWSIKKPQHPELVSYKIAKDSGYAAIAVNRQKDEIWGHSETKNLKDASRILKIFTNSEIKNIFETQGSTEKATAKMISAKAGSIGNVPALIIDAEYVIDANHIMKVEHYVIKTKMGWVVIGLGCHLEDYATYITEMRQIISKISYK